ncbi:hypothetical protein ARMGADRAFT_185250 [Armillaria gallica]|uniref:Uncharacterized protein n=1 Tax=Armillaria gallica TaxID=47427 RepID=A0A2H3CV21_ARMGA|nr:hypothetical protein ARMGADRAFT_185250 [Armillaria gallica]
MKFFSQSSLLETTTEGMYAIPVFPQFKLPKFMWSQDVPVTRSGSTLKRVPTPCLPPNELETWNSPECVLCLPAVSSQCSLSYQTGPSLGGLRGWTFVFSCTLVSRFMVNVGITNVETRGETHSTHSVPSAVLDLPNFGCRRFEYPIFGCFFQVLAWPVHDPRVFQASAKGLNTSHVLSSSHTLLARLPTSHASSTLSSRTGLVS